MTISGTNLSMVRGDSERLSVSCSTPFASGDQVAFTVRKNVESPVDIRKIVTSFDDGKAVIAIDPADTADMDFGAYVYDIQVTWGSGIVKTVVKKSIFNLEEEVTY